MLVPLKVIPVAVDHPGRFFKYQCDTWYGDGCALHYLGGSAVESNLADNPFIKVGDMELHLDNTEVSIDDARETCDGMKSKLVEFWDAQEFEEVNITSKFTGTFLNRKQC